MTYLVKFFNILYLFVFIDIYMSTPLLNFDLNSIELIKVLRFTGLAFSETIYTGIAPCICQALNVASLEPVATQSFQ